MFFNLQEQHCALTDRYGFLFPQMEVARVISVYLGAIICIFTVCFFSFIFYLYYIHRLTWVGPVWPADPRYIEARSLRAASLSLQRDTMRASEKIFRRGDASENARGGAASIILISVATRYLAFGRYTHVPLSSDTGYREQRQQFRYRRQQRLFSRRRRRR